MAFRHSGALYLTFLFSRRIFPLTRTFRVIAPCFAVVFSTSAPSRPLSRPPCFFFSLFFAHPSTVRDVLCGAILAWFLCAHKFVYFYRFRTLPLATFWSLIYHSAGVKGISFTREIVLSRFLHVFSRFTEEAFSPEVISMQYPLNVLLAARS